MAAVGIIFAQFACTGCLFNSKEHDWLAKGWTTRELEIGYLSGIAYGKDTYVAVGAGFETNMTNVFSSSDGTEWTRRKADTSQWFISVVWAKNIFVAVGFPHIIYTSSDGVHWTAADHPVHPGFSYYNSVVWTGNRIFVAGGLYLLTSSDGVNWEEVDPGFDYYLQSIAWTGTQLIGVGGGRISISTDGTSWTEDHTFQLGGSGIGSVYWNGDMAVVHWYFPPAEGDGEDATFIYTSPDGRDWTRREDFPAGSFVRTDNEMFLFQGRGVFFSSTDGKHWTRRKYGSSNYSIFNAIWKDGRILAVGRYDKTRSQIMQTVFTWQP